MTTPPNATVQRLAQSRVQVTITFTDEQRAVGESKALQMLAGSVKVDGFRPGKAPADVVKQKVNPERLVEETIRALLPDAVSALAEEHKVGLGKVAQPLRVAITGATISPPIFDSVQLLGKEKALVRIDNTLKKFTGK